jgi:hypothetical protein
MDNYYVVKKNGKYAMMKEGGKRAVKLFQSEQEALDYISTKGTVGEVDVTNLWNPADPPETAIIDGVVCTENDRIVLSEKQAFGCPGNCKCKKPSLLSRILNFFKKS